MASNSNRRSSSSGSKGKVSSRAASRSMRKEPKLEVHQGGLSRQTVRSEKSSRRTSKRDFGGGRRFRIPKKVKVLAIALIVLAVALGGAYAALYNAPIFRIKSIEVEGAERLSNEYLSQLLDVSEGSTLLNVSTTDLTNRLSANPWVKSVSVHRHFPDTIVLKVEESYPCAVVRIEPDTALGAIEYWLIDENGTWMSKVASTGVDAARKLVINSTDATGSVEKLGKNSVDAIAKLKKDIEEAPAKAADGEGSGINDSTAIDNDVEDTSAKTEEPKADDAAKSDESKSDEGKDGEEGEEPAEPEREPSVCEDAYMTVEELAGLPLISGVTPGVVPETGVTATDEGLLNALDIVIELDEEFSAQIATINAATDDTTGFILKNGVEVAFGKATDISSKVEVIEDLLKQHEGKITYINVRVVSNPVWRGL
ncbi:MAG: FtsQ-type POTRA domain-containing protein [bacterium]|nr:FtsQ-type POTRA domain-containing protein [bacterium]